jgi:hypothetical protein
MLACRARARAWSIGIAVAACGALFSGIAVRTAGIDPGDATARAIADLRGQAELTEDAAAREREVLAGLRRDAETIDLVRLRPDWTRLVAACARAMGEESVLERISLEPQPGGAPRLMLVGWAADQGMVASSVLTLERTGLLSGVRLVESKRSTLGKADAVRFTIEAVVTAPQEPLP